ncbi:hypothetical protein ACQ4PT_071815 [Festuca glaucescens]
MAASSGNVGGTAGSSSPRSARIQMEEALGKLDITEEEATPLVLDDREEEGTKQKWSLAGKVLSRNFFHIQTISSILRPAWGNPKGLLFRSVGRNMLVADFDTQRDRDRVMTGSPWHVNNNAVILEVFVDHMRPSELKFDKLQLWARVINLPFNLRNDVSGKAIAKQLDKNASSVLIDPVGGYLRARITVDVNKPLRRGMLIDSAKRQSTDWYDIQYENIPFFCFSCGRLGYSDGYCPTPGSRNADGKWPFGPELRADDGKKSSSAGNSSKEQASAQTSNRESHSSSNAAEKGTEVTSPAKRNLPSKLNKRKMPSQWVQKKGDPLTLAITAGEAGKDTVIVTNEVQNLGGGGHEKDHLEEEEPKKKKPTPTNSETSAVAVMQPCLEQ